MLVTVFGAGLGFVLMAWDGLTSGSWERALRDGVIGAGIGAVSGFIGGQIAESLFDALLGGGSVGNVEARLRVGRAVAWAVFGAVLGGALGFRSGAKAIVNGLVGGFIGGLVGGLVFEQVELSSESSSGFAVRLLGFTATGVGISVGMGVVERLRREAWLVVTGGPLAGKEFILYKPSTTVGSDFRADIVLAKDSQVVPVHATFERSESGTTVCTTPGAGLAVNGQWIERHHLRDGDVVTLGMSTLGYQERATA